MAATGTARARAPIVAWVLVVLCACCAAADTYITLVSRPLFSEAAVAQHGWPVVTAAALAFAVMAALIISRYPGHLIGWLMMGAGVTGCVSLVLEAWSIWAMRADGPGSERTGRVIGWASQLFGAPLAIAFMALVFLTVPTGHLAGRRWRWAAAAIVAGALVFSAGILAIPPDQVVIDEDQDFGLLAGLLTSIGISVLGAGLVAAVVCLVRRLRRASGVERLQLRWVAASATFVAFGLCWLLVLQAVQGDEQGWLDSMPLFCSYLGLPIAVAIAVLRHQLFDIDLIINRAALVAIATAFVAAAYVALVVTVGGLAGGGFWLSIAATAVVALAFQPLRRRVVWIADRLAFGERAAPYEALADFTLRLGESPHPDALLPAVAESAARAVRAGRATVTLYVDHGRAQRATWPPGSTDQPGAGQPVVETPIHDRGEPLGMIALEMPPGRGLREHDLRLVRDLADQAAIAFRNTRLTAELEARVDELRQRTVDLVESRRRLISAGDAERRRLERAIAREVTPHLQDLPARLAAQTAPPSDPARAAHEPWRADSLAALAGSATAALESLRDITRGVYPAQLVRGGLQAALQSYLGRAESRGRLEVHASADGRRFDSRAEAAAYFCVAEAARDLVPPVQVAMEAPDGELVVRLSGRPRGAMPVSHMRDRVEAAGGTMLQESLGDLTVLDVRLPTGGPQAQPDVPGQAAVSRSGPNADLVM